MRYFAYGVNMNRRIMSEHCPGAKFICAALLEGYALIFDGQSIRRPGATANIEERAKAQVWGALFEITEKELAELDAFENYPASYLRKEVTVTTMDGQATAPVIVYYRTGQAKGLPGQSYFSDLLEGARACDLPKEYLAALEQQEVL